jgi:uncharacterized protein YndB with AHSA1/START domain
MTIAQETSTTADRELRMSRTFDAPAERLFDVFTDTKNITHWWGPRGFRTTTHSADLRPGGEWHFTMHGPDGTDYPNKVVYVEINRPRKLAYRHMGGEGHEKVHFDATITFTPRGQQTELDFRMVFPTREERDAVCGEYGAREGLNDTLTRLGEFVASQPAISMEACMIAKPEKEHEWLQQMVGDWTFDHACPPGPDGQEHKASGTERVYSLGGLWIIGEGQGNMPDGSPAHMRLTLGYDPAKKQFVGTWIGSMMTHLWTYAGTLDPTGKILTLDTEGPNMAQPGKLSRYQDIYAIVSPDHRTLTSRMQMDDGTWQTFMTATYRRKK